MTKQSKMSTPRKKAKTSRVDVVNLEEADGSPVTMPAERKEAHRLVESQRRQKINQQMTRLQNMVPGAANANKSELLSKAADYIESLETRIRELEAALVSS